MFCWSDAHVFATPDRLCACGLYRREGEGFRRAHPERLAWYRWEEGEEEVIAPAGERLYDAGEYGTGGDRDAAGNGGGEEVI